MLARIILCSVVACQVVVRVSGQDTAEREAELSQREVAISAAIRDCDSAILIGRVLHSDSFKGPAREYVVEVKHVVKRIERDIARPESAFWFVPTHFVQQNSAETGPKIGTEYLLIVSTSTIEFPTLEYWEPASAIGTVGLALLDRRVNWEGRYGNGPGHRGRKGERGYRGFGVVGKPGTRGAQLRDYGITKEWLDAEDNLQVMVVFPQRLPDPKGDLTCQVLLGIRGSCKADSFYLKTRAYDGRRFWPGRVAYLVFVRGGPDRYELVRFVPVTGRLGHAVTEIGNWLKAREPGK